MSGRAAAAWVPAVLVAAWALMRLGGLERGYPLVQIATFTPYVAGIAVVAALFAAALRQRIPALVAAVSALALVAVVAPRAVDVGGGAGISGAPLTVLSANVYFGKVPAGDVVALARRERADVVSVQELTPRVDAALARAFPHRVAEPRRGALGTGLYSRFPLNRVAAPRGRHAQVAAIVRARNREVRVVAVHSGAPLSPDHMATWKRDLRALPAASRTTILAGDFNASLDHRELRRLVGTGYRVAAAEAGAGLKPTWRGSRRWLPPVTIDHVLVGAGIAVDGAGVHELPPSDHNAVSARLVVR